MANPGLVSTVTQDVNRRTTVTTSEGQHSTFTIRPTRSALSSTITLEGNVTIGKHPLVQRLVKGVFQCRPSFPRYERTWDTNVELKYLKTLPDLKQISLCDLAYKRLRYVPSAVSVNA